MTKESSPIDPLTRPQVLIAMGVTAIILLLVAKVWLYFDQVIQLPLRWQPQSLLLGLGVGLGITGASSLVYRFWPHYRQSADYYLALVIKPLYLPDLIWLGLLPGLSEELLFRGVMLPALGFDWLALILSSACFGVLHLSGKDQWAYSVWATLVGLILGYCALITGNLLIPITAHVVTNLVSSLLWKLGENVETSS